MPATEYPGSFLGRISIRRNQVISMEGNHEQELEDLELFQKHVSDRFSDLLPPPSDDISSDPILSIAWLRRLLDEFLCCEAQFKAILIMGRDPTQIAKPPLDRLLPEFLDRIVKALDICNAVLHGIESVRQFQKLAEIAISALDQRPIGDGQVKRARRALNSLITSMAVEDKDCSNSKSTERAWSFGRRAGAGAGAGTGTATPQHTDRVAGQFRSLSWSMAKGWSAAKQIQAMSTNLVAPRGGESSGLPQTVYLMSTVLVFVMWILVAALPCQERGGLPTNFPMPKQLSWAQPMIGLQEKIAEEWKKKEKKGSAGILEEMQRMDKLSHSLMDFSDSFTFPLEAERLEEVGSQVAELGETCKKLEEGLLPLQQQIREVFHRVVRSRSEILDLLDFSGRASSPIV